MKTNIDLDPDLVSKALELTGLKTKKELVHHALSELVRIQNQQNILKLRGQGNWEGDLNEMRASRA